MEIITSEFWHRLVPDEDKFGNPKFVFKNQPLIFCPAAFIGRFFRFLQNYLFIDDFVLITGGSDHGIFDLIQGYGIIHNSTIHDSFNEIPKCIKKWFLSGSNIKHEKIQFIPLGVCDDGPGKTNLLQYLEKENTKEFKYYVNWSNHTLERYKLKERWKNNLTGKFYVKENIPYTEFHEDLSKCEYTICTHGMGLDCYRNYEALACGSTPILLKTLWSEQFKETIGKCVLVNSWLELENNIIEVPNIEFDINKISQSYWKEIINKEVQKIIN
jgi:hypothetical protein